MTTPALRAPTTRHHRRPAWQETFMADGKVRDLGRLTGFLAGKPVSPTDAEMLAVARTMHLPHVEPVTDSQRKIPEAERGRELLIWHSAVISSEDGNRFQAHVGFGTHWGPSKDKAVYFKLRTRQWLPEEGRVKHLLTSRRSLWDLCDILDQEFSTRLYKADWQIEQGWECRLTTLGFSRSLADTLMGRQPGLVAGQLDRLSS